jgi:group I intron endonuclease
VYGENDLLFSIIEECEIVCLIDKEREYLKTLKPHFNIYEEPGSPKNHKFSDEARKNMSDAHMGKTQSEKTKKKRSLSLTGHSVSKKTTDKIVEKRKNYRHSKETLLKMSISHMGKSYDVDDNENSGSRKRNKGGQFVKKN